MERMDWDNLEVEPATPERWSDLETLFGKNGACGGCWCVFWKLPRKKFDQDKGETNRLLLKNMIDNGETPGLLGYLNGQPVGWISLGPREVFPTLENSRNLKPVDDQKVWSVVCHFIARKYRKKGFTLKLLKGAMDFAQLNGANILEAYPVDPPKEDYPDVYLYTGILSTYLAAGFVEVARRSSTRPIVRKYL
jgi:hypothetical protein